MVLFSRAVESQTFILKVVGLILSTRRHQHYHNVKEMSTVIGLHP